MLEESKLCIVHCVCTCMCVRACATAHVCVSGMCTCTYNKTVRCSYDKHCANAGFLLVTALFCPEECYD